MGPGSFGTISYYPRGVKMSEGTKEFLTDHGLYHLPAP